jgi:hypothetical protein
MDGTSTTTVANMTPYIYRLGVVEAPPAGAGADCCALAPAPTGEGDAVDLQYGTVTFSGQWFFLDHRVSESGISGTSAIAKSIRRARVEIQRSVDSPPSPGDAGWTTTVITYTNDLGAFQVADAVSPGSYRARICTIGPQSERLVVAAPSSQEPHCDRGPAVLNPTGAEAFPTRYTPDSDAGSGPFNIYDALLEHYEYLAGRLSEPTVSLTAFWEMNYLSTAPASYYRTNDDTVHIRDGDHWDESIIVHEAGHWLMDVHAAIPPNAVGDHYDSCPNGSTQPNLHYSEAWADFYSSAVRATSRDSEVVRLAHRYIEAVGGIGSTSMGVDVNLENNSIFDGQTQRGTFCEWQIAGMLWDVLDPVDTAENDSVSWTFPTIYQAFRTRYNNHYPHNVVEWWYGWTNTLGNDTSRGVSTVSEDNMLTLFDQHRIDVGVKITLKWTARVDPEFYCDLNSHLWLPADANQYHVMWGEAGGKRGQRDRPPFSYLVEGGHEDYLNCEDVPKSETMWLVSPYPGTYTFAAFSRDGAGEAIILMSQPPYCASGDTGAIYSTDARVEVRDGAFPPYTPTVYAVQSSAAVRPQWWHVFDLNGATGAITVQNSAQICSPGTYERSPQE